MKQFFKLLAILVLLTGKAFAQTDPVRTELDHIFYYIDKSQVPNGYLDEYGPQFADKKWLFRIQISGEHGCTAMPL